MPDGIFEMTRRINRLSNALRSALLLGALSGCAESTTPAPVGLSTEVTTQKSDLAPAPAVTPTKDETKPELIVTTPADPPAAAPEPEPAKSPQPAAAKIYDTETPGTELIATALRQARRDHKRVLIEWGYNSCVWCIRLHKTFTGDSLVKPLVSEEYVLVLVESRKNHDLLLSYGGKDRDYSYPHLTILDEDGQVLVNQNTEPLEKGNGHDPEVVADFLKKWMLPRIDAEDLITKGLEQAAAEQKRVLLRVGDPYCGWCKVLSQFLLDHADLMSRDYVDVKVDTIRMSHGKEVASRYQPSKDFPGAPWIVILDPSGKPLATSIAPEGNIGYPYQPSEIDHFVSMLRSTRQKLTDADLEKIHADLTAYRTERESKKQKK